MPIYQVLHVILEAWVGLMIYLGIPVFVNWALLNLEAPHAAINIWELRWVIELILRIFGINCFCCDKLCLQNFLIDWALVVLQFAEIKLWDVYCSYWGRVAFVFMMMLSCHAGSYRMMWVSTSEAWWEYLIWMYTCLNLSIMRDLRQSSNRKLIFLLWIIRERRLALCLNLALRVHLLDYPLILQLAFLQLLALVL